MNDRIITQSDLDLTYQHVMNITIMVDVYDKNMVYIDSMDCALISGSFNMDASSDVRRTISLVLSPTVRSQISLLIEPESLIWINRNIVLYAGIQNHRTQEYTYYKMGTFIIMTYSSAYDATTNQLTLNCSDWMAKLDGSKNGELWALTTSFPAYKEFYSTEATGGTDCYYITSGDIYYTHRNYRVNSPSHTKYIKGDYVVLQIPERNIGHDYFQWNDLNTIPIFDKVTGEWIEPNVLKAGNNYAFKFGMGVYYHDLDPTGQEIKDRPLLYLTSHVPIAEVKEGVPIDYYIIREAMITAVTELGGIKDYEIDDIGEYYAMPQYNDEYDQYRTENPLWNNIPYDLEFSSGDNVLSIITTLRDLYPNYEIYFNEDAVFCCNMIPSDITDDTFLSDEYLQKVLISENYDIDTTTLHNVCMVWGESLEVDFTAKSCVLNGNIYRVQIDEYGKTMYAGDVIAITIPTPNPESVQVQIITEYTDEDGDKQTETYSPIDIYDEMTDMPLAADFLEANTLYVFKIKSKLIDGKTPTMIMYYQSEYQPQALDVLTTGKVSDEQWECDDGTMVPVWSKEYFADKYGCKMKNIHFTKDARGEFTVQELGEILSVKQGGEFENITSDQRALARAEYENWKSARLVDTISITIKLCLFLDVNKKIEFRRHDQEEVGLFIITSVSHDFSAGTSTIGMTRFWPLYADGMYGGRTHDDLAYVTHNYLRAYSHAILRGK